MDLNNLKLIYFPNEILKTNCEPIESFDSQLKELSERMLEFMNKYDGIGIAAIQIGIKKKVVVAHVTKEHAEKLWNTKSTPDADTVMYKEAPLFLVNPKITLLSGANVKHPEGCLSFPNYSVTITRPEIAEVEYFDLEGNKHFEKFGGILSRCIQHEVDHVNGITLIDRIPSAKRYMAIAKLKKLYKQKSFSD